jgi:hypothetical protein
VHGGDDIAVVVLAVPSGAVAPAAATESHSNSRLVPMRASGAAGSNTSGVRVALLLGAAGPCIGAIFGLPVGLLVGSAAPGEAEAAAGGFAAFGAQPSSPSTQAPSAAHAAVAIAAAVPVARVRMAAVPMARETTTPGRSR